MQNASEEERNFPLAGLTPGEMTFPNERWVVFAHQHQLPLVLAANGEPWLTWLMIGGRGAGKTRAGAEWVRAQAVCRAPLASEKAGRIALVGETEHDVREVMIEGVSGLMEIHERHERPVWIPSARFPMALER